LVTVQPADDVLFNMIRTGQPWTGHLPTEPARDLQVRVLNATGEPGLAARTAAKLRRLGFHVTGVGNAPPTSTTTVEYAGLVQSDGAYTLMAGLKSVPAGENTLAEPTPQVGRPGPVTLVLGTNFAGVKLPAPAVAAHAAGTSKKAGRRRAGAGQPGSAGTVQSRNAAANICSGLPSAN
jgi:hypothetical protein